jgi:hypothetical protein
VTKKVPVSAAGRTTTNEVHHFEVVSFFQDGIGPSIAGNDVAVQLDRNPVGFQTELLEQRRKRERSRRVCEIPLFAVDVKFHSRDGGVGALQKDCSAPRFYSALRKTNFLVVVRPSKFACTSNDESASVASSTSILTSAAPAESATTWV